MTYQVTPGALPKNYEALGARLRAIDKLECRAHSGLAPADALRRCVQKSHKWYLITWDGEDQGMFGISPTNIHGCGSPWFLSTDKVFKVKEMRQAFISLSPSYLRELEAGYDILFNVVSVHNSASIRWLRSLGFHFPEPGTHWLKHLEFREFWRYVPGGKYHNV